jgi:amidophosphoribosyltransferase
MCGVIGIIGLKDVSRHLYHGLIMLQHRGQDSAGIITCDDGGFHIKKGRGLVTDVFGPIDFSILEGDTGIGNVRYPTIGSLKKEDIQPFTLNSPVKMGITHNGNLVNAKELKEQLMRKNREVKSDCDTEVILNVFADALEVSSGLSPENIFEAVGKTMEILDGSYSEIVILDGGLLAFRDPRGIKPLVLGKKKTESGDSYMLASETTVLNTLGFDFVRNIEPGEAVFIDRNLHVHSKILAGAEKAHCMFEWVYFSSADSVNEDINVYRSREKLGKELANLWKQERRKVDIVVAVPDTSRPAALAFAKETGAEFSEGLIKNKYIGRTFIMATPEMRKTSVRLKHVPIETQLKGKSVAVIDDSIVRGTTSKRIVRLIKNAGAKEVHFIVTCPPIKFPCFYGIDMSTRKELIASQKSIEEIREELGADSLTYQTIEGLKRAIGTENLCMACLNGIYPSGIEEPRLSELERIRDGERCRIESARG